MKKLELFSKNFALSFVARNIKQTLSDRVFCLCTELFLPNMSGYVTRTPSYIMQFKPSSIKLFSSFKDSPKGPASYLSYLGADGGKSIFYPNP